MEEKMILNKAITLIDINPDIFKVFTNEDMEDPDIQLYAVTKNPKLISLIKSPSRDLIKIAIEQYPIYTISYVDNSLLDDELIYMAIEKDVNVIPLIKDKLNSNYDMAGNVIKLHPQAIQYLDNLGESSLTILAVKLDPNCLIYFEPNQITENILKVAFSNANIFNNLNYLKSTVRLNKFSIDELCYILEDIPKDKRGLVLEFIIKCVKNQECKEIV